MEERAGREGGAGLGSVLHHPTPACPQKQSCCAGAAQSGLSLANSSRGSWQMGWVGGGGGAGEERTGQRGPDLGRLHHNPSLKPHLGVHRHGDVPTRAPACATCVQQETWELVELRPHQARVQVGPEPRGRKRL